MSSPAEQLKGIESCAEFPAAILALCPDGIRLQRLTSHLLDVAIAKLGLDASAKSAAIKRVRGGQINKQSWTQIAENVNSLSLFSSTSIFIIDEVNKLSAELTKEVAAILANAPSSTKMILTAAELAATNALRKYAHKKQCIVELEELKGVDLKRWTQKELKQAGFRSGDAAAVEAVMELGENSPDKIAKIVELLALYSESDVMRMNDLRDLLPDRLHSNEFHLLDSVLNGNESAILRELTKVVHSGKAPLALLGLVNKNLSTLASIRVSKQQGMPDPAIREQLRIPEWLYKKHMTSASRIALGGVPRLFHALLRADSKFKNYSLGDAEVFSELFESIRS